MGNSTQAHVHEPPKGHTLNTYVDNRTENHTTTHHADLSGAKRIFRESITLTDDNVGVVEAWRSETSLGNFFGGLEIHSAHPIYGQHEPNHTNCRFIGNCWHDGSTTAFYDEPEGRGIGRAFRTGQDSDIIAILHDELDKLAHRQHQNNALTEQENI